MNKRKLGAVVATVMLAVIAAFALRSINTDKSAPVTPPPQRIAATPVAQFAAPPPAHLNAAATHSSTSAAAWKAKFDSAEDYFRFVKEALLAAQAGDGRAAYFIAEVLSSCAAVMYEYRGSADPEAQLQQELANYPRAPQWARDMHARDTRRCFGLAKEDPFAGLPPPAGGFTCVSTGTVDPPCNYASLGYWKAQALAAGDALAQIDAATSAANDIRVDQQMPEDVKAAKLKVIKDNLRVAVESGDPDALHSAGILILHNPRLTSDNMRGMAVALAACDLGGDCQKVPEGAGCVMDGTCPAGANYAYFMEKSLGPERYAQLYAQAQQVVQLEHAGDYQGVLAYLTLDKHP